MEKFVQKSALNFINGGTLEGGLATIDCSKDWIVDSG